jgi:asparagine synthase (glutamine-hydrolysing)
MCGIAGCFSPLLNNVEELSTAVGKMIRELRHRGPDDQGMWTDPRGRIILGHRRLSIIDLSLEGHQPMASGCGRWVISLNGEIYNFLELRRKLEILGVRFRGHSDTEVFLEAISQWGIEKTLTNVVGMFAFALWDTENGRLVLCRDRAGKKPLYYLENNETLYFASEIKAFKVLDDIHLSLDHGSLYQYLTFGYVPAPKTIYEDVLEVPAGHYMIIDQKFNFDIQPYWNITWNRKISTTFDNAIEEANRLLNEAVKIRLRADVPVGCFLSGGIDSGLLTAIASRQLAQPLKTFTVSFTDGTFDESSLADLVAKKYETDHYVLTLSPRLEDILPKVVNAYDEPFADPSAIPSYCVSAEASKHVKVILNGEGGDELFGGYRRHIAIKLYSYFEDFFEFMPEIFWDTVNKNLPQPKAFRSKYAFFHRFMRGLVRNPFNRYMAWCVDGFHESEKASLFKRMDREYWSSVDLLTEKYEMLELLHPLDHFMAMDFLLAMHDDMLVKMDIATMAHGLEGRNPFLDHRLIEWAISLAPAIRMKGVNTKPILRELAKRYLPAPVVTAPKRGFEIPLIRWLRHDLSQMVSDVCLSSDGILLELFNKDYVEKLLFEKHHLDPDRWSRRVWTLFMLALWGNQNR